MYGTELSLHKYETDLQVEWQKESDIKTVSAQKTYLFFILKNYVYIVKKFYFKQTHTDQAN